MAITKIQSESLNLADDFAFTGTITGAGGTNTPYFYAYQGTSTSIPDSSFTKITMDSEIHDSAGAFSSSRFTVPAGQGGKYFFYFSLGINYGANIGIVYPIIYKNGSEFNASTRMRKYHPGTSAAIATYAQSTFLSATAGDYYEIYCYQTSGTTISSYNSNQDTFFYGYKIIE